MPRALFRRHTAPQGKVEDRQRYKFESECSATSQRGRNGYLCALARIPSGRMHVTIKFASWPFVVALCVAFIPLFWRMKHAAFCFEKWQENGPHRVDELKNRLSVELAKLGRMRERRTFRAFATEKFIVGNIAAPSEPLFGLGDAATQANSNHLGRGRGCRNSGRGEGDCRGALCSEGHARRCR
jgi:hypothetical protein